MILEMNNIRKHFDGLGVLEDISFGVEKGEVVSIIGPSGSGKSTLLRCATFLEEIDGGEILYMGEKAAWTDADGKAVYVPQRDMRRFRELDVHIAWRQCDNRLCVRREWDALVADAQREDSD